MKNKVRNKDFEYYRNLTRQILSIISRHSGQNIIIDSSKSAPRALALSKVFGKELTIIYLTRNLFDVVNSFQRKRGKMPVLPFLRSVLKDHFKFRYACRRASSKSYLFNYDHLFDQQKLNHFLAKINQNCGIDLSQEFHNTHVIAGNRMRYKATFTIERSKSKRNYNLTSTEKFMVRSAEQIRTLIY